MTKPSVCTWRRGLLSIALALFLLPAAARAHLQLVSSAPADAARVVTAPRDIVLTFSIAPELALTRVTVTGPAGAVATEAARALDAGGTMVGVALPAALPAGRYQVRWTTASSDGHPVTGTFTFDIAAPVGASADSGAPASQPLVPGPAASHAILGEPTHTFTAASPSGRGARWIEFVGIVTVLGALGFVLFALPGAGWGAEAVAESTVRARGLAMAATGLLLLTGLTRLWGEAAALGGSSALGVLLSRTSWGTGWAIGAIGVIIVALGLLLAKTRPRGWLVAAAGAALVSMAPALTGHAIGTDYASVAVALDTAHVLGAGLWVGTLAIVMLVGIPVALTPSVGGGAEAVGSLLRTFHRLALVMSLLLIATGIGGAALRLDAIGDLFATDYGQLIFRKIVLAGILVGFGAYHARSIEPARWSEKSLRAFRWTAAIELVIAAGVLALTAVLVSTAP